MAEIAIIMATYNGERFLREQIDSILDNSFKDIELHICDDGSTDGTEAIATEYVQKYQGKVFFHKNEKNLRVIKNFLVNIKKFDAPYYMLCDQDDFWLKNKVETEVKALECLEREYGEHSLLEIYSNYYVSDASLNNKRVVYQNDMHADFNHLVIQNWIMGCTMMVNEALLKYGRVIPPESENHDRWLSIIASLYGHIEYISEPLMIHRVHNQNATTQADTTSIKNRLTRVIRRYSKEGLHTFREKNIKLYKDLDSIHLAQQYPLWHFKMIALQHGSKSFKAYKKYNFQGVDKLQTTLFGLQFLLS